MRILSFLLLSCCFAGKHSAQNLVLNPSFEQLKPRGISVPCQFSQYSSFFAEQIEVWTTYSYMTPDLLHAAENCSWLPQAHSGEYCAGIIHYLPGDDIGQEDDYHEKISGRLAAPLKPGRKYRLSCWVREDEAIIRDHLASVYTAKTPVVPLRAGNLSFYFTVAKARAEGIPQVVFTEPVASNGVWVELSAVFVPDQPFQHFTMGNFFRDNQTKTDLPPEKHKEIEEKNTAIKFPVDRIKRAGYLCIDDVSIIPEPEPEATSRSLEDQLVKERKFTFSAGVLFDFDKADLRPEAGPALDSLATFLKDHPGSKIGISGHTDDRGSEAYNLDLSGRRAKAVHDYLLEKGIPATQVEWKAFGKSRPVADNNTEEGRQMNRRVECILLKMR